MKPGTALAFGVCVVLGVGASLAYRSDQRFAKLESEVEKMSLDSLDRDGAQLMAPPTWWCNIAKSARNGGSGRCTTDEEECVAGASVWGHTCIATAQPFCFDERLRAGGADHPRCFYDLNDCNDDRLAVVARADIAIVAGDKCYRAKH